MRISDMFPFPTSASTSPSTVDWTPYTSVGLTSWALDDLAKSLAGEGVRLVRLRWDFDTRAWPRAKAGLCKFKEAEQKLIAKGGLG